MIRKALDLKDGSECSIHTAQAAQWLTLNVIS